MSLFGSTVNSTTEKDVEVVQPPPDSISALAFSPQADFLAASSWDNNVRVWEVAPTGQTQGKAMYAHQGPVLDVCWNKDGTHILSGGADNAARMFDVSSGQSQQVAQHDAPIKCVRWIDAPTGGILATGSWDKTIKYWDLRQSQPIATVTLPERVYAMDVTYPLLAVGTADKQVLLYSLTSPTTVFRTIQSPLKWQTRAIATFAPSVLGFAIGSVEGRVGVQYAEEKDTSKNYSFRCHRKDQQPTRKDQSLVYAVNSIKFHPVHGTVATSGADGSITFWDLEARTRLKTLDQPLNGSISATCFNRTGNLFVYAVSYDWHKGYMGMTPDHPNKIMIHPCKEDEVKKRTTR